MQDLNCGEEFESEVSLGARAKDQVVVFRRCAPLQKTRHTEIASGNSDCFIERDANSCEVVCYENGRVKMDEELRTMSCDI